MPWTIQESGNDRNWIFAWGFIGCWVNSVDAFTSSYFDNNTTNKSLNNRPKYQDLNSKYHTLESSLVTKTSLIMENMFCEVSAIISTLSSSDYMCPICLNIIPIRQIWNNPRLKNSIVCFKFQFQPTHLLLLCISLILDKRIPSLFLALHGRANILLE